MGQLSFAPANNAGILGAIGTAPTVPLFELQTGPTDYVLIMEISTSLLVNNQGTLAYPVGLGTPAAKGVGVNPIAFVMDDNGNTGKVPQINYYSEWTQLPTVPTTFLRRMVGNSAGGSSTGWSPVLFRFPRGYKMLPSTSLVFWSFGGATPGTISPTFPIIVVDG